MPLTFAERRRRRWPRVLGGLVVVGAIAAGTMYVLGNRRSGPPPLPSTELRRFLTAWSAGDAPGMAAYLETAPPELATTATALVRGVPGNRADYARTSLTRDRVGGTATATYHARVELAGFGPLEWNGTLTWVRVKSGKTDVWRIRWRPDLLFPQLAAGQQLAEQIHWPARASIFAADGSLLAGAQSVVVIGLEPDRVSAQLPQIKQLLQTLVGTDPASVDAALHAPGVRPNFFVPVATVPDDARYTTVIRPQLYPIPGVFFRRTSGVLAAPSAGLAAQAIGRVGEITAQRLRELGAPYRAGDQVGLSGLQASFEKRLAGAPSADVVVLAGSKVVRVVKRFPGRPAQPVRLTIDPRVQSAAEAALAGVPQPAALVAIDASTGAVRAAVSKPDGGFDRALAGTYPPGSTFKVVTSAALLENGRNGATPAPCPPTLTVDGRVFKNFEGEASGSLDLARAFAISCNNAFIGLADQLPAGALQSAASSFGFGARWSLPLQSFGGAFPAPRDRAELAASAIGQARVLASPLQMASVAATVDAGQWHQPVLTMLPPPETVTVAPLSPGVVDTLRSFMAGVLQPGGTAAGAGLPADSFGKTGTAEFGSANPPATHAWYIGFRGNLAFAVIVEGGGVGGRVAAPIAAKFLAAAP